MLSVRLYIICIRNVICFQDVFIYWLLFFFVVFRISAYNIHYSLAIPVTIIISYACRVRQSARVCVPQHVGSDVGTLGMRREFETKWYSKQCNFYTQWNKLIHLVYIRQNQDWITNTIFSVYVFSKYAKINPLF